jgi:hypothetical protein
MSPTRAWRWLAYQLTARRCACRGYPHRIRGGTVQYGGTLHRIDGPCYACDTYGSPL